MKTPPSRPLCRELALVRVRSTDRLESALDLVGAWSARLLELEPHAFAAELSGTPERIQQFVDELGRMGEVTYRRSGVVDL